MTASCQALVQNDGKLVKESIPFPTLGDNQLLVKVAYVAQNPTDVQSLDGNAFGNGAVLGCDFVGTVREVGSQVRSIKVGATVAGLIWGGEIKGRGGYSEYTVADERICFEVPKGVALDKAATVPLALCTAWLSLFSPGSLGIPRNSDQAVLVWGASSSVGSYAVQIAALQGLTVIATCSPKHYEDVRRLGATHVFDYRDQDVVAKIMEATPNLQYGFDTIGSQSSSEATSRALGQSGGRFCTVRPGKANTEKVTPQTEVTDVLVWTAFLKDHRYGDFFWPANQKDHEIASELFQAIPEWLSSEKIKPSNTKVYANGLDDVAEGFQEYRDGKISNYKLVYKL